MRLGIVIYIIPVFFVYRPTLILQGGSISLFLFYFSTCIIGVYFLSCATEGYMQKVGSLEPFARILFFMGGLLIAAPNTKITILGIVLSFMGYLYLWIRKTRLR